MTFKELGQLAKRNPRLRHIYGEMLDAVPDEMLAERVLKHHPQYWQLISPTARKIKQVADTPIYYPSRRWFESSTTEVQNESIAIQNRRAYLASLHEADMLIEAAARNIPVTALHDIAVNTHQTDETMRLEQFRRDNGLDGADRTRLTPHNLIQQLEDRLMRLIDRRDAESHPDKRSVLSTRIRHLQEELDARGQQAVVSAGGGIGLRQLDEDTNGPGSSQQSDKADVEPVPAERNRVGF